jgi:hypothetical protein
LPSANAWTCSLMDASIVRERGPGVPEFGLGIALKLNTARMKVLELSSGSVATFAKNYFQSSLWKRYCSTFDV